jgi:hypothetical protein
MGARPDPAQRQRQAARLLTRFLDAHPDLPTIDWTLSQYGLHAHFYLCHVDPCDDRKAFIAWTTAMGLTQGNPGHGFLGADEIRAHRLIDDVLVILTATIHPF